MRAGRAKAGEAVGPSREALGVHSDQAHQRRQRQSGEREVVRLQAQDRARDQRRDRRGGKRCREHRGVAEPRYCQDRGVSADPEQRPLRKIEGAELAEHELVAQPQQGVDADQSHQALAEGRQDGERKQRRQDQQDEPEAAHHARRPAGSPNRPLGLTARTARTTI